MLNSDSKNVERVEQDVEHPPRSIHVGFRCPRVLYDAVLKDNPNKTQIIVSCLTRVQQPVEQIESSSTISLIIFSLFNGIQQGLSEFKEIYANRVKESGRRTRRYAWEAFITGKRFNLPKEVIEEAIGYTARLHVSRVFHGRGGKSFINVSLLLACEKLDCYKISIRDLLEIDGASEIYNALRLSRNILGLKPKKKNFNHLIKKYGLKLGLNLDEIQDTIDFFSRIHVTQGRSITGYIGAAFYLTHRIIQEDLARVLNVHATTIRNRLREVKRQMNELTGDDLIA